MATILIIEDDQDSRDLERMALEMRRHVVIEAATAEEGIALARARRPDVIVLDLGLPGPRDGLDVVRELREEGDASRVAVIAVTAFAQSRDRDRALEAGCDDYLTKPIVDLPGFVALVEHHATRV